MSFSRRETARLAREKLFGRNHGESGDDTLWEEYTYVASGQVLIPRDKRQELESTMRALNKKRFEEDLTNSAYQQVLCDFFNSEEFEDLKEKWRDHSQTNPFRAFQDVDVPGEVKTIEPLKPLQNQRRPHNVENFLKFLSEGMSDHYRYVELHKGMTRVFTAKAVQEFVEEIGEDCDRISRAWRQACSMSMNNGFRTKLKPNKTMVKQLVALRNDFPNFAKVVDHILMQLQLWPIKNSDQQRIKPILLNGPKGTGKSAFAKALAQALGSSYAGHSMAAMSMGGALTGISNKWSNGQAGLILNELSRGDSSSPLILLDEIDKMTNDAQYPVEGPLLGLLEPQTSKNQKDEFGQMEFDASEVIYVATSNDSSRISPPLYSRFDAFNITYPSRSQRVVIIENMLKKSYRNTRFTKSALEYLARQDVDLRSLQTTIDKVVACHVDVVQTQKISNTRGKRSVFSKAQVIEELTVRIALDRMGIKTKQFDHIEV